MEESREDVALLQFYGVFGGWAVAFFLFCVCLLSLLAPLGQKKWPLHWAFNSSSRFPKCVVRPLAILLYVV